MTTPPRQWSRAALGAALVASSPLVAVGLLSWMGALAPPTEPGLAQPGAVTSYGLPVTRALRDLSAAVTIGVLLLTAVAVPPEDRDAGGRVGGARHRLMNVAVIAGSVWVWSGVLLLLLTYGAVAGVDPFAPGGMQFLNSFLGSVELGQAILASTTLAAATTVGSMIVRSSTAVGVLLLLAIAALWPLATTGHAAGALNHDVAVNALMVHLVGVSVWVGGLVALLLARRWVPDAAFGTVVRRFSTLAGWAVALVAVSGIVAAATRLTSWADLTTSYGTLVALKVLAFSLLVAAGWWQRHALVPRIAARPEAARPFAAFAAAELVLMTVTIGVAVALSSTPPPPGPEATTPAEALLGHAMPPPLTVSTFLTEWRPDTLWMPLALLMAAWYARAVVRLRRRGDSWSGGRTVAWFLGCLLLLWVTSGSPGAYGRVLFSMHMLQHMFLAIAVPTFLVLGAPATLALRTLPARRDGSRGPREWLLLVLHSRLLNLLSHPVMATGIWIVSLVAFYMTSLFELSLRSHTMHLLMVAHFLISGYLLASAICGVDPGPRRVAHPFRVVILMMSFGAHALFSVSLMSLTQVLAEPWFSALGRTWGPSLLRDQYVGAQLGWVAGDYPIAILGGALIWSWVRSDVREAKRRDRQAERDGDAELRQYNEYLRSLHERR